MIPRRPSLSERARETAANIRHFFRILRVLPPSRWPAWVDSGLVNLRVGQELRNHKQWVGGLTHMGFTRQDALRMVKEMEARSLGERYGDWRDPLYEGFEWGGNNRSAIKKAWRERRAILKQHLDFRMFARDRGYTVKPVIGSDREPKYRWRKIRRKN